MKEMVMRYVNHFSEGTQFYLSRADSNARFTNINRAAELINGFCLEPGINLDQKLKQYKEEFGFEIKNKDDSGGRIYLIPKEDF